MRRKVGEEILVPVQTAQKVQSLSIFYYGWKNVVHGTCIVLARRGLMETLCLLLIMSRGLPQHQRREGHVRGWSHQQLHRGTERLIKSM